MRHQDDDQDSKDRGRRPRRLTLAAGGCGERTTALPSGVKYADPVVGRGDPVKSGDFIEVRYTGWLQADDTRLRQ